MRVLLVTLVSYTNLVYYSLHSVPVDSGDIILFCRNIAQLKLRTYFIAMSVKLCNDNLFYNNYLFLFLFRLKVRIVKR